MDASDRAVEDMQPEDRFAAEVVAQLDAMLSFALRFTRARADAEDLVSDTILRALDRRHQYQLGTNVRAWLFTILYRLFVARRRGGTRELPFTEDEHEAEADPEGRFFDSLVDETVMRALDELPGPYRAAVVLSDMQGLDYREIAELLGVPSGTVKSRIFRGRRRLRTKLAEYAAEMGFHRVHAAA
jgi:RNA polymerase sigma-70 factor (ECF subfamily)